MGRGGGGCSVYPERLIYLPFIWGIHGFAHSLCVHCWVCRFRDYMYMYVCGFVAQVCLSGLVWLLFSL